MKENVGSPKYMVVDIENKKKIKIHQIDYQNY